MALYTRIRQEDLRLNKHNDGLIVVLEDECMSEISLGSVDNCTLAEDFDD